MPRKRSSEGTGPSDCLEATCWICLGDATNAESGELIQPCLCPRYAHQKCLARWQLQNAGKPEEAYCRFCEMQLPDWTSAYAAMPRGEPLMTISHNGRIFLITASPGEEGREDFIAKVRAIFGLREEDGMDLSFGCKVPGSPGEEINLEGWECYDAAVHCASICAGQRTAKALNLRDADAVLGNAMLSTAAPGSSEPHVSAIESEEAPPGCMRLVMDNITSFWESCLETLQEFGKRVADEARALGHRGL